MLKSAKEHKMHEYLMEALDGTHSHKNAVKEGHISINPDLLFEGTVETGRLLIHDIGKWAIKSAQVESLLLIGSYARQEARNDSDIDFVLLTNNPEALLEHPTWCNQFGRVLSHTIQSWETTKSLRVFYENGHEVEFNIGPLSWAAVPVDDYIATVLKSGYKILVDKSDILKQLILNV